MSASPSRFTWYELMTPDMKATTAFYGDVVGWSTLDASAPGMTYLLFTAAGAPVGGVMNMPAEARAMNAPPSWIGYIGVDDVDAVVSRVTVLGGAVHMPPRDIPDVGRFSVVADPQGAAFAIIKWVDEKMSSPNVPGTAGHIGWHELYASDWQKAFDFYKSLFGWEKADAVDMGPMGTYQLFSVNGQQMGGMFNKPPHIPVTFWLYYFNVGDINAATERVKTGGGKILNGPMEVPGGQWIVQCLDPAGAMFALVGRPALNA